MGLCCLLLLLLLHFLLLSDVEGVLKLGSFILVELAHQKLMELRSAIALQVSELLMKVEDLVDVVQRRVIQLVVASNSL